MVPCWHQAVPNEDGSSATMVESDTSLIWINIKGRGNMSFEEKKTPIPSLFQIDDGIVKRAVQNNKGGSERCELVVYEWEQKSSSLRRGPPGVSNLICS